MERVVRSGLVVADVHQDKSPIPQHYCGIYKGENMDEERRVEEYKRAIKLPEAKGLEGLR